METSNFTLASVILIPRPILPATYAFSVEDVTRAILYLLLLSMVQFSLLAVFSYDVCFYTIGYMTCSESQ